MHAVSNQEEPWACIKWWRRAFDLRAREELLARLFQELRTGKPSGGALLQFVALLTLSPFVKLSRATLFLLAGIFVIFAVWEVLVAILAYTWFAARLYR